MSTLEARRERQKRIRAAIKAQTTVRKVWLLPAEMIERVLRYQEEKLLPSEVAAARELLNIGLKAKGF